MSDKAEKEIREFPEPWRELFVETNNGSEIEAMYTGDGWMLETTLFGENEPIEVISWRYKNDGE